MKKEYLKPVIGIDFSELNDILTLSKGNYNPNSEVTLNWNL